MANGNMKHHETKQTPSAEADSSWTGVGDGCGSPRQMSIMLDHVGVEQMSKTNHNTTRVSRLVLRTEVIMMLIKFVGVLFSKGMSDVFKSSWWLNAI